MGHIVKTPAGTFRANWRDEAGRQKAKTFRTKKEAAVFLADTEARLNRGSYVDPHAGRQRFGPYAERWLSARNGELTTTARDASIMRTHVIRRWGDVPIGKIDHLGMQGWVATLGERLAPATVAECLRMASGVLRSAVRDRLIGANPCEGVRLPRRRKRDGEGVTITPTVLTGQLLPVVPARYRALVALAGGTGLRWGECVGLRWNAVEWDGWDRNCDDHDQPCCLRCVEHHEITIRVLRVAVEVAGTVTVKPYPKTRAGRRTVPVPPFVAAQLCGYREAYPPGPAGEIFTNLAGGPVRRTLFRSRIWRPSLVRAGLLGKVVETGPYRYRATWPDRAGVEWSAEFTTERDAVAHVANHAAGGLRFHDLRHSYATWLVSRGLPVNDIKEVMGHENASTTLNRYTHGSEGRARRVLGAFADDSLASVDEDE
jgi:integrase